MKAQQDPLPFFTKMSWFFLISQQLWALVLPCYVSKREKTPVSAAAAGTPTRGPPKGVGKGSLRAQVGGE